MPFFRGQVGGCHQNSTHLAHVCVCTYVCVCPSHPVSPETCDLRSCFACVICTQYGRFLFKNRKKKVTEGS